MWPRASRHLLDGVTRLPRWLGRGLLAANRRPQRLLGPRYARYAAFLTAHARRYDATPALLAFVNTAIEHVPYYRARYRPVRSIHELEDTIGLLDKQTVVANADALTSRAVDLRTYERCSTGGTEGAPMTFLAPRDRYVVELATMHALWARAGFAHDVRAVIRNHRLRPGQDFVINPITREVIFDGFELTAAAFARIYEVIRTLGIRFVHCYPSTAHELARFIRDRGLDPSVLTAFLSGSENVFGHQRALIQDALGVRFYNWYGHSEKLLLGGYCEAADVYHLEPTYGYFELVADDGRVIRDPGGAGEMVGTSLHNPGMPLIRYRTGDRATYVGDRCEACGRVLPVIRDIQGRWSGDRIYKADGTFVTTTSLNIHAGLDGAIDGMQYVQERRGELDVLIVRSPRFGRAHEAALRSHLQGALGTGAVVTLHYVDRLRRHRNGKFTHLISSVTPDR